MPGVPETTLQTPGRVERPPVSEGATVLPDRQLVGICTVHRSSEDSSVEVPMKSKFRQLWVSLSSCISKPCWLSSFKFRFFPEACKNDHIMSPKQSLLSSKLATRLTYEEAAKPEKEGGIPTESSDVSLPKDAALPSPSKSFHHYETPSSLITMKTYLL